MKYSDLLPGDFVIYPDKSYDFIISTSRSYLYLNKQNYDQVFIAFGDRGVNDYQHGIHRDQVSDEFVNSNATIIRNGKIISLK